MFVLLAAFVLLFRKLRLSGCFKRCFSRRRKNKRDPLSFMYKVMKESDERHTEREEQRIDFAPRLVSSSNKQGHATEHQGKSSRKNHREKESSKSIDSDYYVDDATDKSKKRHTESGAHRRKQRKSRKKRSKSSAAGDVDWVSSVNLRTCLPPMYKPLILFLLDTEGITGGAKETRKRRARS